MRQNKLPASTLARMEDQMEKSDNDEEDDDEENDGEPEEEDYDDARDEDYLP